MEPARFTIRYDGYHASEHELNMGQLGDSLRGLDRLTSTGLIALSEHRYPKRGERFGWQPRVMAPRENCVEIVAIFYPVAGLLPLAHEVLVTGMADLTWRWLSWAFLMKGGREKDAIPHFEKMIELVDKIDGRNRDDMDKQRQFCLDVLERVQPALRDAVKPVGPSCDQVSVIPGGRLQDATVVELPMADAIRSSQKVEVGDMESMRILVDGFIGHNRQVKFEDPTEPGRYRDPLIDDVPNLYSNAAGLRQYLDVQAKPSYRDGRLHSIYIMDAKVSEPQEQGRA